MQNPANFGLAKGFLAQGLAHGFDMTAPEGIQAGMETYNAGLGVDAHRPLAPPRARTTSPATGTATTRRKPSQRGRQIKRKKR